MEPGRYYVIAIHNRPIIEEYPKFVKRYLSNIIGFYTGSYISYDQVSCMFEHTIPRGHYFMYSVLTQIANNRILNSDACHDWVTHIYKHRFKVIKDITPVVQNVIDKFKSLKSRRQEKTKTVLCVLQRYGVHTDISMRIVKDHLYPNVFHSK